MAPDLRRNQHKSRPNTCADDDDVDGDDEEEEVDDAAAVRAGPVHTSGRIQQPTVPNSLIIKAHYVLCFR